MSNVKPTVIFLMMFSILSMMAVVCSNAITEWSPEHQAAAHATGTAIAPSLYATQQYQYHVLPTAQAVEAAEAQLAVETRYHQQRKMSNAITSGVVILITMGVISGSVTLGAWGANCIIWAVQRMRRVVQLPPCRILPDRIFQTPYGIVDPRTGYRFSLLPGEGSREHAAALTEYRVAVTDGIVRALITLRNGERHPGTIAAWNLPELSGESAVSVE